MPSMTSSRQLLKRLIPRQARPLAKRLSYRLSTASARRRRVAQQLRSQADVCAAFSSPLYATLLSRAATEVEQDGPCWTVLREEAPTALGADDALALRFMGAVHRLALEGSAPSLAAHYPSTGGDADGEAAWPAFQAVVAGNVERLRDLMRQTVQTNEVGRCGVLAGGFLLVAARTGLPLRLLELGASAGLNLRWDRYRYEHDGVAWGDPVSPVRLGESIVAGRPPYDVPATVAARAGCDLAPIDPCSEDGRLTLTSFVWPDQTERLALLRGALAVAEQVPIEVERADAASWLERQLATPADGVATVVYHSFVIQFVPDPDRERIAAAFARAGARATETSPLAWLRMEWGAGRAETRLTTWPGGREELIATSTPHGAEARWLAAAPAPQPSA